MTKSSDIISHDKPCTLCGTPRPILVRCQIDESGKWHLVCPGKCWTSVSGGVEDAKGYKSEFPHYRYGGMWKNKHADGPLSAKKPMKVKVRQKKQQSERQHNPEQQASDEVEEQTKDDVSTHSAEAEAASRNKHS